MRIEEGKVYRIDTSRNPNNEPFGHFPEFESYNGREVTMFDIQEEQDYGIFYDSWYFAKDLLVEVEGKEVRRVLKEDTRTYTDFKVGDLVRIRSVEDLKQHFYSNEKYIYTMPIRFPLYDNNHIELAGKTAIITNYYGDTVEIELENSKNCYFRKLECSTEELEIVEEGYQKRVDEELQAKRIPKDIDVDTDEVVQEMLKKVDIDKFKKILTGALRIKGTALLGVDKLLKDWACAKREIYLALGRNLVIRKPIEYLMENNVAQERKTKLEEMFPRFLFNYKEY